MHTELHCYPVISLSRILVYHNSEERPTLEKEIIFSSLTEKTNVWKAEGTLSGCYYKGLKEVWEIRAKLHQRQVGQDIDSK